MFMFVLRFAFVVFVLLCLCFCLSFSLTLSHSLSLSLLNVCLCLSKSCTQTYRGDNQHKHSLPHLPIAYTNRYYTPTRTTWCTLCCHMPHSLSSSCPLSPSPIPQSSATMLFVLVKNEKKGGGGRANCDSGTCWTHCTWTRDLTHKQNIHCTRPLTHTASPPLPCTTGCSRVPTCSWLGLMSLFEQFPLAWQLFFCCFSSSPCCYCCWCYCCWCCCCWCFAVVLCAAQKTVRPCDAQLRSAPQPLPYVSLGVERYTHVYIPHSAAQRTGYGGVSFLRNSLPGQTRAEQARPRPRCPCSVFVIFAVVSYYFPRCFSCFSPVVVVVH